MTTSELLTDLAAQGITIRADGVDLICRPKSKLTPTVVERIRSDKPALLAALTNNSRLIIDPNDLAWDSAVDLEFCPVCGGCNWWWDFADRQHCANCQPPIASINLLERRETILRRLAERGGR